MSENIHRACLCRESLGSNGLVLTSHSRPDTWLLPTSQTHQWRDVGGISAIVPNLPCLPMADIANRSQYSFSTELPGIQTLTVKWEQPVSGRAGGRSPRES